MDWTVQLPWLACVLAGDGTLGWSPERPNASPQLQLCHTVADEGWLEFKCEMLRQELGLEDDQLRPGKVIAHGARYAKLRSPIFRPIWEELYGHGDRGTNGHYYKQLLDWPYRNPENILRLFWFWYLDDGCMGPQGCMELKCYQSEVEMQALAEALESAFRKRHGVKIDPTIKRWTRPNKTVPGNEYGLRFSVYETSQILKTYFDYLPEIPCMRRKLTMPETKTGKRLITRSQLASQGPAAITPEQSLAVNSMGWKELRALVMAVGIGYPRTVNGKQPKSKAAFLSHIRQHTVVADEVA